MPTYWPEQFKHHPHASLPPPLHSFSPWWQGPSPLPHSSCSHTATHTPGHHTQTQLHEHLLPPELTDGQLLHPDLSSGQVGPQAVTLPLPPPLVSPQLPLNATYREQADTRPLWTGSPFWCPGTTTHVLSAPTIVDFPHFPYRATSYTKAPGPTSNCWTGSTRSQCQTTGSHLHLLVLSKPNVPLPAGEVGQQSRHGDGLPACEVGQQSQHGDGLTAVISHNLHQ